MVLAEGELAALGLSIAGQVVRVATDQRLEQVHSDLIDSGSHRCRGVKQRPD